MISVGQLSNDRAISDLGPGSLTETTPALVSIGVESPIDPAIPGVQPCTAGSPRTGEKESLGEQQSLAEMVPVATALNPAAAAHASSEHAGNTKGVRETTSSSQCTPLEVDPVEQSQLPHKAAHDAAEVNLQGALSQAEPLAFGSQETQAPPACFQKAGQSQWHVAFPTLDQGQEAAIHGPCLQLQADSPLEVAAPLSGGHGIGMPDIAAAPQLVDLQERAMQDAMVSVILQQYRQDKAGEHFEELDISPFICMRTIANSSEQSRQLWILPLRHALSKIIYQFASTSCMPLLLEQSCTAARSICKSDVSSPAQYPLSRDDASISWSWAAFRFALFASKGLEQYDLSSFASCLAFGLLGACSAKLFLALSIAQG